MSEIDLEWLKFLQSQHAQSSLYHSQELFSVDETLEIESKIVERQPCEELYISTQTKIFFLNKNFIDVDQIFWNLKVLPYTTPANGVIKKQMRVIFHEKDKFELYIKRRDQEIFFTENVIKQIDNPNARKIKFKDVRKLTVGVSKKDIMNCHGKQKNAFINCFAVILRVLFKNAYQEIHVKVFNTGRLAIPGIVNDDLLEKTKILLLEILQPNFDEPISLIPEEDTEEVSRLVKGKMNQQTNRKEKSHFRKVKPKSNVLINSNFNCGYYIQQEKLKTILTETYGLHTTYDPSMYPGVKCKFYYNNETDSDTNQTGRLDSLDQSVTMTELDELILSKYTKVSFMIFRTGNCLIVGNCSKTILMFVFSFVRQILMDQYEHIHANHDIPIAKEKKNKIRKKTIYSTSENIELLNNEKRI